nr:immunoglobulin heavy chain junction region [Mus musculus]MBK4185838.1 immunoglobulin heavy chain junction region [Mus musculus]
CARESNYYGSTWFAYW